MTHFIEPLSLPLQERLQQIMTRPWTPTSWREFNAWNLAVHNELGHNASAVDTLAMLIPTLHQQPYAADIPWAEVLSRWATQFLQHTTPANAHQTGNVLVAAFRELPSATQEEMACVAFDELGTTVQCTVNHASYMLMPALVTLGRLGAMTSAMVEPTLKKRWLKMFDAMFECPDHIVDAIAQADMPTQWKLDWLETHGRSAAWIVQAPWARSALHAKYSMPMDCFDALPFDGSHTETNRNIVRTYFPEFYALLDTVTNDDTWRASAWMELRELMKTLAMPHTHGISLPTPEWVWPSLD